MRRELILVFLAISTMIVIAFVVPLGLSAQATARDRALDEARAESAALVPLVATGNRDAIINEVGAVNATGRMQVTVLLGDGTELGAPVADRTRLDAVIEGTTTLLGPVEGGQELVTAVALPGAPSAAVRIVVPEAELRRGVVAAWATLVGLGVVLILGAVVLADQVSQRIIRPATDLAHAAAGLGAGDFSVHVTPSGPPELATTAEAFNILVGRVRTMVDTEREMMAELTHRLRTPLTRLRVGLDQIDDPSVADKLHGDVRALTSEINDLISRARHHVDPPALIDIGPVVARRFEFWAVLAAEEGRDCVLGTNDSVYASVETDDLEAAVDVLIENIFAHTPPGTSFVVSTVSAPEGGGSLIVEDGGSGFEPSLAVPGQSGAGSTGLGLAIVGRLVARCGGTLGITNREQGGARVECRFPPHRVGVGPEP